MLNFEPSVDWVAIFARQRESAEHGLWRIYFGGFGIAVLGKSAQSRGHTRSLLSLLNPFEGYKETETRRTDIHSLCPTFGSRKKR
jgi:hypothetical protein